MTWVGLEVFQFSENDTRIFQYSKGEWDDTTNQFKSVFADPAKIRRQLDIAIPNRNSLIDQHLAGLKVISAKDAEVFAYERQREADPTLPEREFPFTEDESACIRMGGIAHERLCAGVRAAFELVPFDEATGRGCTDYMVVSVFNHYNQWLEKKDGSMPPTQTS